MSERLSEGEPFLLTSDLIVDMLNKAILIEEINCMKEEAMENPLNFSIYERGDGWTRYCAECGFLLKAKNPMSSLYTKSHMKWHAKWEELERRHGKLNMIHDKIEEAKSKAWKSLSNLDDLRRKATTDEERAKLDELRAKECEKILFCFFERSLSGSGYERALDHVSFPEYAALILNARKHWSERFGEEPYDILVKKYGTKKGMQDGYTYGGWGSESRYVPKARRKA